MHKIPLVEIIIEAFLAPLLNYQHYLKALVIPIILLIGLNLLGLFTGLLCRIFPFLYVDAIFPWSFSITQFVLLSFSLHDCLCHLQN